MVVPHYAFTQVYKRLLGILTKPRKKGWKKSKEGEFSKIKKRPAPVKLKEASQKMKRALKLLVARKNARGQKKEKFMVGRSFVGATAPSITSYQREANLRVSRYPVLLG